MKQKKIGFIIVPVVLFALLAICIQAGMTIGFEGWAYSEAAEEISPFMTTFMKAATYIGESYVVLSFCLLLFVIPKSRKSIALPVSAAVIISGILPFVLKEIFARQRPDILRLINETGYSFPSGHAMINAALYTMLVLLVFKFIQNKTRRVILSAFCAALTIVIGISRIYLGVHYAGDVIGGWLIGFAVSVLLYFIWSGEKIQKINRLFAKKRDT
jgi:undecaprenyl-diphosphatase